MDCDLFRKNLNDFMEDKLPSDIKKAMEKHMEECDACRGIYENEAAADEVLYDYMQAKDIDFSNIRLNIVNNIDKNRYKNSFVSRLHYTFKNHGRRYVAAAALIAFLTVSVVQIFNGINFFALGIDKQNASKSSAVKMNKSMENAHDSSENTGSEALREDNPYVPKGAIVLPRFIKQPADVDHVTPDSDNVKKSPDGNATAVVIGRGEKANEEGIANILLTYKNKEESIIKLTDNSENLTPKLVEWKSNDELYVIVGYAYGTVTVGGNLYSLNINTMEVTPLYIGEKFKREVRNIKIMGKDLQLSVNTYDTKTLKYRTDIVLLKYSQIQNTGK